MNNYAVIKINKEQYKVSEGDEILVPGTLSEKPEIDFILRVKDGKVVIGKPNIEKLSLKFKVIGENVKGEKINVLKYKAKSRYRKRIGFRSVSTKILIEKIG